MMMERYRHYTTSESGVLWILAAPLPDRLVLGQVLHVTVVRKPADPGEKETYYPMYRFEAYLGEFWYPFQDRAEKTVEFGDEAGALTFLDQFPLVSPESVAG